MNLHLEIENERNGIEHTSIEWHCSEGNIQR